VTHPTAQLTRLELKGGAAEFAVSPRKAGELLEVSAGRFRFRVLGTRFRVAHAQDGVSLAVTEGKVAVLESEQTLRVVTVGGTWSEKNDFASAQFENAPVSLGSAVPARAAETKGTENADCLALSRRNEHEAALACFAKQASGTSVSAEVAQYEMARIQHDALGQAERSLETLRKYRERFTVARYAERMEAPTIFEAAGDVDCDGCRTKADATRISEYGVVSAAPFVCP
jgi:hypothetical protein